MRIAIAVGGKWDMFQLAEQLERRGHLDRILTSYPRFVLRRERVSPDRIVSLSTAEWIYRGLRGLPHRRAEAIATLLKCLIFDRAVAGHVRSLRADALVTMSSFSVRTLRAAREAGILTLLSRNNCHIRHQKELLDDEARRWEVPPAVWNERILEREEAEYQAADHVRVPSSMARESFLKRGFPPDRVHVVCHGVDVRDFSPRPKKDDVFRVLYVGTISVRKGVAYLLEAVRGLRLPSFECVLIGPILKEAEPILERYRGLYRHEGPYPQRELSPHYSQGSVYVFPSIEEGMAASVVEAMACGLPVIVSENAGVDSVVRNGVDGFIVPVRQVEALREKILDFYEHPNERSDFGRRAAAHAKESTWDQYGDQFVTLFKRLLGGRA